MLKYTSSTLKKLENLYKQLDYKVRYEKGSFKSGYCLVEHRKVVVINKFYTKDARIQCLIDILAKFDVSNTEKLDDDSLELLDELKKIWETRKIDLCV